MGKEEVYVFGNVIRQFITEASKYGMPTRFLDRVRKEYHFTSSSDSGKDETSRFWQEIALDRGMWASLQHPGFTGFDAVDTLYHEATHAYIDLEDYGETREFEEAREYYSLAKLADGNSILNKDQRERAVEEALAEYVGHRASTLWRAWSRLDYLAEVLRNVSAGKYEEDRGTELIVANAAKEQANPLSVPAEYNINMQERVFGYVEEPRLFKSAVAVRIASKPIPDKLREHCDKVILEDKIYDDFNSMLRLRINFETLYKSMTQFPLMAEAMMRGSTSWMKIEEYKVRSIRG